MYVYVCTVCMYVCMCVCMYVCMCSNKIFVYILCVNLKIKCLNTCRFVCRVVKRFVTSQSKIKRLGSPTVTVPGISQ